MERNHALLESLTLNASVVVLTVLDDNFCTSSSRANAEFFVKSRILVFVFGEIITTVTITTKNILGKYLRLDVKDGFFLFRAWFMVFLNHTADAIFNFLATLPIREDSIHHHFLQHHVSQVIEFCTPFEF